MNRLLTVDQPISSLPSAKEHQRRSQEKYKTSIIVQLTAVQFWQSQ